MHAGFHHDELPLGDGLQLVGGQERPLRHLQALARLLALVHGAGQYRAVSEGFGQRLCCLAVRGKAAEDRVLTVVLNDLAALLTVILLELGKTLDDRHQRQTAGPARGEERKDIKGGHRAQLVAEEHNAVFQLTAVLVGHGEQLAGQILDHQSGHEVLGRIFFRQDQKDRALL